MNKRIAKKKYIQALKYSKIARKDGISVLIKNDIYANKDGKEVPFETPGAKLIKLKKPKIQYYKVKNTL